MNSETLVSAYLSGLLTMGHLVAAGFFFRFWRSTGDRLFAAFCIAFLLLAANYAVPTLLGLPDGQLEEAFPFRVGAFLIIGAVLAVRRWGRRR